MGNRWYDNTRIIWGLFGVIGLLLGVLCTIAWGQISSNESDIQSIKIQMIEGKSQRGEILHRLERIERKIDNGRHQ